MPKNEEYFCGDGGPATAACLYEPSAVLVDPAGNLFVADERNRRVRRVDTTTGTITTVAGSNVRGFCGDGGPATSACLLHPVGLAMDALGNLLIADDSRIRRVQCVPDTDGDGLCDAYDLSDLGGLTLQMAFVRSAHKPSRQLLVRFRAMLDTRTYAAANSGV